MSNLITICPGLHVCWNRKGCTSRFPCYKRHRDRELQLDWCSGLVSQCSFHIKLIPYIHSTTKLYHTIGEIIEHKLIYEYVFEEPELESPQEWGTRWGETSPASTYNDATGTTYYSTDSTTWR